MTLLRLGCHELDPGDARASRHYLGSAFIPGTPRATLSLAVAEVLARLGLAPSPQVLVPAHVPAAAGAVASHEEALAAACEALARQGGRLAAGWSSGLSRSVAGADGVRRREVLLWRGDSPDPEAIAKVAHAPAGAGLAREREALDNIARLAPDIAECVPRVLAASATGDGAGPAVLVHSAPPGRTLARLHAENVRPGRWSFARLAAVGSWLGRFHAATSPWPPGARLRHGAVHGSPAATRVVVRPQGGSGPHRLVTFTHWEASVAEGPAVRDAVSFLLDCGRADLSRCGPRWQAVGASDESLAEWLLLPGSAPFRAARAFWLAWTGSLELLAPRRALAEEACELLPPALRSGLLGPHSALN